MILKSTSENLIFSRFLSQFSSENLLSDRLFWAAFYICVGFLPPFIAIFGHRTVFIPFLIINILVLTRLVIRPETRLKMWEQVKTPPVFFLFLFALLVIIHASLNGFLVSGSFLLFTKPTMIFMGLLLLVFVWSHQDIIKAPLLLKIAFRGLIIGCVITLLKIITLPYFFDATTVTNTPNFIKNFWHIHHTMHAELKVISIFLFLVVLTITNIKYRFIVAIFLLFGLWMTAFYPMGFSHGAIISAHSDTVKFGVPLAFIAFITAWIAPKITTHLLFAGLSFFLATAPWLFQYLYILIKTVPLPRAEDFLSRGEIWDAAAQKILDAPFFGYGIDSLRYLQHVRLNHDFMIDIKLAHPHNMFLQIWLDLGFLGVSILLALLFLGWKFLTTIDIEKRPFIIAAITMLAAVAMVSHSFWQTWSMALFVFFIIFISIQKDTERSSGEPPLF